MNDPVKVLMEMEDETVSAKYIAPILKMNPSVIVKYAKDGTWDADRLGKYVISGGHVKFFRKDFLVKCGFMEPEKEEPTDHQLLEKIWELLMEIRILLKVIVNEKPAGAGTPTE